MLDGFDMFRCNFVKLFWESIDLHFVHAKKALYDISLSRCFSLSTSELCSCRSSHFLDLLFLFRRHCPCSFHCPFLLRSFPSLSHEIYFSFHILPLSFFVQSFVLLCPVFVPCFLLICGKKSSVSFRESLSFYEL